MSEICKVFPEHLRESERCLEKLMGIHEEMKDFDRL